MRLAHRLLLGTLLVVSVLVAIVVGLSGRRLRAELEESLELQLAREARLVAASWQDAASADSLADAAGGALGHRVTLLDSTGRVLGDSEFTPAELARLASHSPLPEIAAVRRGDSLGVATRPSVTTSGDEMFVAASAARGIARVSVSTSQLDAIVAASRRDVLLSGALAIIVALVLAALVSRDVSRPIEELRDVTQALASGDLSRRPSLSAPGEVGDLAGAIHRMAEQLGARLRALQAEDALLSALIDALHEGVVAVNARRQVVRINDVGRQLLGIRGNVPFSIDFLPRERVLREALGEALAGRSVEQGEVTLEGRTLALTALPLAEGGAVLALFDLTALRRLETVRRDFVANVSHELKTPLTVISGFAETLETDDLPPAQRHQFIEAIRSNARRMHRIVDDLLDLSRIESGGWRPNPARSDLLAVAAEAVGPCRSVADEKGVAIEIAIQEPARHLVADPTALRQIISNLVENSIRYTARGGRITVFADRTGNGVRLGVRDTGVGIAPEHLPRVFERFYRADPSRSREDGGTGLGLSIVRHLAEAHGARVSAESSVGRGTTVAVLFPESATVS